MIVLDRCPHSFPRHAPSPSCVHPPQVQDSDELRRADIRFRLCVDDFCHGAHGGPAAGADAGSAGMPLPMPIRGPAVPWFTMVSCATAPTIPLVQWNVEDGAERDVDLSRWDAELERRQALRLALPSWSCRSTKAVFRGAVHSHHGYNTQWSTDRVLARRHVSAQQWRTHGRVALAFQR